jgi:hypothetical protein
MSLTVSQKYMCMIVQEKQTCCETLVMGARQQCNEVMLDKANRYQDCKWLLAVRQ